jgi:hypothetical protein
VLLSAHDNSFSLKWRCEKINILHIFVNIRYKKVKKSEVNSTIIKKIEEMLKGSLALKSDEVIRGENIGRYVDKISKVVVLVATSMI